MNQSDRRKLRISELSLIVIAAVGVIAVTWFAWAQPSRQRTATGSYTACVQAGNPVLDSYPSVCVDKQGHHYTNPTEHGSY